MGLRSTSSDTAGLVMASLLLAVFCAGFVELVYNPQWPVSVMVGVGAGTVGFLLLRNRENNVRKWRKNPTTFPNPLGGGIVGEYMKRPWREELAELGRAYGRKHKDARSERARKKDSEKD